MWMSTCSRWKIGRFNRILESVQPDSHPLQHATNRFFVRFAPMCQSSCFSDSVAILPGNRTSLFRTISYYFQYIEIIGSKVPWLCLMRAHVSSAPEPEDVQGARCIFRFITVASFALPKDPWREDLTKTAENQSQTWRFWNNGWLKPAYFFRSIPGP